MKVRTAAGDARLTLDDTVSLAHGNGGRRMRELIESVFAPALQNPLLDTQVDAIGLPAAGHDLLVVTTDGFTVQPLEFPGGDIGSLSVFGTVNDLAVAGAVPRYLTLSVFLEEGFDMALLRRIAKSIGRAARDCGVAVVAGDTKVVRRGECDGLYLATTGIGYRDPSLHLGMEQICIGDQLIISGPIGEHGTAVMLARENFGLHGDLKSDAASVLPMTRALQEIPGLKFMRDPTRGGLATVAHEIARATGFGIRLLEAAIPVSDQVQSVCELLGFDPLYLACEGCVLAVVGAAGVPAALRALRTAAPAAAVIGEVVDGESDVILCTEFGGERVVDELEDDALPRIC